MVTKKLTPKKASKPRNSGHKKPVRRPVRRKKANRKWKVNPWLVAGLILVLAAGVLYPYFRNGVFASEGAAVPSGTHSFCVDLSHHNTGIVWDSLKVVVDRTGHTSKDLLRAKSVHPVTTVILKATEGEKFTDRKYSEYWEEAGKRPYTRGAYHFSVRPGIPNGRRSTISRKSRSGTATFPLSSMLRRYMRAAQNRSSMTKCWSG